MDAAACGLKFNTTLRELTLEFSRGATNVSPILSSLRDHPLLRRLCLRWRADLTGLETVLLSGNSKITELEINMQYISEPSMGLTRVLQAFGRYPTLTKLGIRSVPLDRDNARLLGIALSKIPILQSLDLARSDFIIFTGSIMYSVRYTRGQLPVIAIFPDAQAAVTAV